MSTNYISLCIVGFFVHCVQSKIRIVSHKISFLKGNESGTKYYCSQGVEARKCESISLLTKGQRIGNCLYSFKVIVFLPQRKLPPRFRTKSPALSGLLSTGVTYSQPLFFWNREVGVFLPQTKV